MKTLEERIQELEAEVEVLRKYRSQVYDHREQDAAWEDAVATWKTIAEQTRAEYQRLQAVFDAAVYWYHHEGTVSYNGQSLVSPETTLRSVIAAALAKRPKS